MTSPVAVSFLIPVKDGVQWLEKVLEAALAECADRPSEIIAVDDGSSDGSRAILDRFAAAGRIRVLDGGGRGAARAINIGLRAARYDLVAQIDQDVCVQPGWLELLLQEMRDPEVAAAQGFFVPPARASLWERVMGVDLRQRYGSVGRDVDHVCTGNTIYRRDALERIGNCDESLGYGYDNDVSYRLVHAGYRLVRCDEARAVHFWRNTLGGYLRQQYGFGYGRIDLVYKHRHRYAGDDVSGGMMMMHAPLMLLALLALSTGGVAAALAQPSWPFVSLGLLLAGGLCLERLVSGVAAWRRFGDRDALWFPVVHTLRDLAWSAAIVSWSARTVLGIKREPQYSMKPRG